MRDQLIRYVDLLFAGAKDSGDIKQEILQNTLDRYDDLVSQGKSPEAAYRLAISGIGDINEILGCDAAPVHTDQPQDSKENSHESKEHRQRRAAAIAFYIASPIPLFLLSELGMNTLGLCLTLLLIAAATALLLLNSKHSHETKVSVQQVPYSPHQELRKSIRTISWLLCTVLYLILSFTTRAWFITWILFPLTGSVLGLINACLDLKEAGKHEN